MRHVIGLAALVAALVLLVSPALADSPHFISASASIDASSGALVCAFKEAGLGNTLASEHITCSADASATWACINGGGNHPKAANKETVNGPLVSGGDFPVRNGQTTGTLSVGPLGPGAFACPPGQSLVLSAVSYTNITLTGQAGDTANVPGSLSLVLVALS